MKVELDPRGRKVVIFGSISGSRQIIRRFLAAGATVTLVVDGSLPVHAERVSTGPVRDSARRPTTRPGSSA